MKIGEIEVNTSERFECYGQIIKENPLTEKITKKWFFMGWYPLPENLDQLNYKVKKDFLVIELNNGELERYRIVKNY